MLDCSMGLVFKSEVIILTNIMDGQVFGNSNSSSNNQPFLGNQHHHQQHHRPQNPYNQVPAGNFHPFPPQPYQQVNQGYPNQGYPNQGFQPNGNPYVPNNQGFVPNGIFPGRVACPFCRRQTDSIQKRAPGGVTWIWCFALFLCTGVCCCIPFCVESCKDTLMICVICQGIKGRIQANCC